MLCSLQLMYYLLCVPLPLYKGRSSLKALRLREATAIEIPLQQAELKCTFRQVISLRELQDTHRNFVTLWYVNGFTYTASNCRLQPRYTAVTA